MIYILNQKEEIIDVLEPNKTRYYENDLHVEDLKEGSDTFEFDSNVAIEPNSTFVLKTPDGRLIPFILQDETQEASFTRKTMYKGDGEYLELRYTRILEPQDLPGQTAESAAQFGLQGTRWQLGVVESNAVKDIKIKEPMNILKYIRMLAAEFELELRFRVEFSDNTISARYVDFVQKVGVDLGKEIIFGKDLQSIKRKRSTAEVISALYVYGPADDKGRYISIESVNGGKKYVEDLDALKRWGKDGEHRYDVYFAPVDADNVTPSLLLEMGTKELKRRINSINTYEANATDMYDVFGMEHERVYLGWTVRIKDEDFNPALYVEARAIRIERSYTDPDRNKFILGDFVEIDIYNYNSIREIKNLLNGSKEKWNKAEENAKEYADGVSTEAYNSAVADAQAWATANGVLQGESYNGVSISNTDGFLTVRGDELVRTVMNSTRGIFIQKRASKSSPWVDVFYVDTNGKLYVVDAELTGSLSVTDNSSGLVIREVNVKKGVVESLALSLAGTTRSWMYGGSIYLSSQINGESKKQADLQVNAVDGKLHISGVPVVFDNGAEGVTSANYANSAGYASSAGNASTIDGLDSPNIARCLSHQTPTIEFLSNGTLKVTHSDGRYSTFVPDSTTF